MSATILMVEDSLEHITMTREYLALQKTKYELDAVSSVDDFWAQVNQKPYDVILLDYNLPDGNGLQILQGLNERQIKTPTIMITGRGDERVAAQTVLAGASDYVIKDARRYLEELPNVIKRVITQAKLRQDLEEAEARYRDLFEQAGEGILICETTGVIVDANPTICKWLGYTHTELVGQSLKIVEPNQNPAPPPPAQTLTYESVYRRKDGHTFPVEISAKHVPARNGSHPAALQFFIRDVTVLRTAQAQLVRAVRLSAVGELAAGVAHQINNPLTTVIADAQLLVKGLPHDHPSYPSAAAIFQAGWRAQRVVQRLLNFSRPDAVDFEETDINETIMEAIDLISAYFKRDGIEVEVQLAEELPFIAAHRHQLEEVWINLLMNARDAVSENQTRKIQIMSYAHNGWIEVTVADNGVGIPEADRAQLFTPFFTTKEPGRGNGLGLSVCQTIVRNHSGEINFTSQAGAGTTFTVRLPRTRKV